MTGAGHDGEAALPDGLAEHLLAAAKAQGVALTGPGGLLTGLTRQVLQTALEADMSDHPGHEHGGTPAGENVPITWGQGGGPLSRPSRPCRPRVPAR